MSTNYGGQTENNTLGHDLFSSYANEVAELLIEDGLSPFPRQISCLIGNLHELGKDKDSTKNSLGTKDPIGTNGSIVLFFNGVGALLSEFKMERLRSLLQQSVFTLTQEVDEMVNPVLSICRIRACLKHKESLLRDAQQPPNKKLKGLSPSSHTEGRHENQAKNSSSGKSGVEIDKESVVIDDDLRFILENDSTRVEELMKKHFSELSATLDHMEKELEKLLNSVMTSCRPMTAIEKQYLRKWIQNLPPKNVDRVVEIMGHNKPAEKFCSDKVHLDLDEEDNVTLWRLYFYVRAVKGSKF